jgi:hypothetical protein
MEAFQGYTKNGHIVPIDQTVLKDGLKVIITVLDEPVAQSRAGRQKEALEAFRKGLEACPPLPMEFDEINQRVKISRELEL